MALTSLGPIRFLHEAYLAVTDFQFYRIIFEQPFRRTLLYLLYLSAGAAVILTLTYAWQYGPHVRKIFRWAEQNFPPFEVKEGKLTVEAEQPLIQRYEGKQTITFVFDTSGTYQGLARLEEPAVLFTEEKMYVRHHDQTQIFLWQDLGPVRVGKEELRDWERWCARAYFPVAYSLLLVYALVAKTVQAVFLMTFGILASTREGIWLKWDRYFTITVYSLVPAVIVDLGVTMTGVRISYFYLIYLGIAALYTYLGTRRCLSTE